MSKRSKTSERVSAYLDGELGPDDTQEIEAAIQKDAALRGEVAELRATRLLLKSLPRETAPEDLVRRVVARAERRSLLEPGVQGPMKSMRRLTFAVAVVVLAAAGVATYTLVLTSSRHPAADQVARTDTAAEAPAGLAVDMNGDRSGRVADGLAIAREPGRKAGEMVAKGAGTADGGPLGQYALVVSINTDNMKTTRRGLERALFNNSFTPEAPGGPADRAALAGKMSRPANDYRTVGIDGRKAQYEVNGTTGQLKALLGDLATVRNRQNVAQEAVAAPIALAKAPDTGFKYGGKDARTYSQAEILNYWNELQLARRGWQEKERAAPAAKPAPEPRREALDLAGGRTAIVAKAKPPKAPAEDKKAKARHEPIERIEEVRVARAPRSGPGRYDAARTVMSKAPGRPSAPAPSKRLPGSPAVDAEDYQQRSTERQVTTTGPSIGAAGLTTRPARDAKGAEQGAIAAQAAQVRSEQAVDADEVQSLLITINLVGAVPPDAAKAAAKVEASSKATAPAQK